MEISWKICGFFMEKMWRFCVRSIIVEKMWRICGTLMEILCASDGKHMEI
nr:MAG TPA: hypothetical protein [Caudoviricetes sp.]